MAQLPQVESAVGNCVADFKDRTKLSYALIFPIMQAVAVRLFIQDFGVEGTCIHFERLVKILTEDGTIRESQFKNFRSPEVPPEHLPHTTELNAILWKLANDLVARGYLRETVASALVNISLKAATKSSFPLYSAGLLLTSLKELRSGVYQEERVQAPDGIDEPVRLLFNAFRDATYLFKEKSGLDWEHLIPGIQRASVVHFIKDRGKEGTVDFLQLQIRTIEHDLPDIPLKSPLNPYITPLHITNMAKFNEAILSMADDYVTDVGCHPRLTAHALSLLVISITTTHFDLFTTMATFTSSCKEIAEGKYDAAQRDADLAAQLAQQRDVVAELPSEHIKSGNPEFPYKLHDYLYCVEKDGSVSAVNGRGKRIAFRDWRSFCEAARPQA